MQRITCFPISRHCTAFGSRNRYLHRAPTAEVCVDAVAVPLEKAINGVPGMTYMTSVSGNDGVTTITISHFNVGVDPDFAAVNVQNRVQTVIDELPEEVIKAGVTTEKEVNSMLMYLDIMSSDSVVRPKTSYTTLQISTSLKN
jgi:HAE1 family hydrophobic/amphiphilic exporter-1